MSNIDAKELRIGNLLDFEGKTCEVKEIDNQGVLVVFQETQEEIWIDLFQFEPIPLSEDYLLKLGFEKKENQKFYHSKFDRTWVSLDSVITKCYGNALGGIVMLDYVHQLQNIFFAINSEELEIK